MSRFPGAALLVSGLLANPACTHESGFGGGCPEGGCFAAADLTATDGAAWDASGARDLAPPPTCAADGDCARDGAAATWRCCGGRCVDVSSDDANCGGCQMACAAGKSCCASACSDLTADPTNCGGCGNACSAPNATPLCTNSRCQVGPCLNGFGDCNHLPTDGCETSLTAVNNCGSCGAVCTIANGTATCATGHCAVASCNPSYADCDNNPMNGCEANLASDAHNCGACGTACASGLCGSAIVTDMTTMPANWKFNGNAYYDATGKSGVLTPMVMAQSGTIIYQDPLPTSFFDVSFDFAIGGGSGADGIGFMVETNGASSLGFGGSGLGMAGLTGFGVELDTYNSGMCGDPNGNHAAVDLLSPACGMGMPVMLTVNPNLPFTMWNTAWHTCTVHFDHGKITVTLDGTTVIGPDYANAQINWGQNAWFGFSGGTGGLTDRQEIKNLKITFSSSQCL
jgi:hypothetical protein